LSNARLAIAGAGVVVFWGAVVRESGSPSWLLAPALAFAALAVVHARLLSGRVDGYGCARVRGRAGRPAVGTPEHDLPLLARIERQPFASDRLVALRDALASGGAPPSPQIGRLERLVSSVDATYNLLFAPVAHALLMREQLAFEHVGQEHAAAARSASALCSRGPARRCARRGSACRPWRLARRLAPKTR
jgi:hypothetical protein